MILSTITLLFLIKFLEKHYFEFFYYFFEKGTMFRSYGSQYSGWYETGNNILVNSILYIFYPIFDFSSLQRIIISFENILISLTVLIAFKNYKKNFF